MLLYCPINKLHPELVILSEASLRAKSKDLARLLLPRDLPQFFGVMRDKKRRRANLLYAIRAPDTENSAKL